MSNLVQGPWRTQAIIGGLYRQRHTPHWVVKVVGPAKREGWTQVTVEKPRSELLHEVETARLLDEQESYHFMGCTADTPSFQ